MNKRLAIGLCLTLSVTLLCGANPAPVAAFPQGSLRCIVTAVPNVEKKANDAEPRPAAIAGSTLESATIVRTGELTRYELHWNGGKNSEVWKFGKSGLMVSNSIGSAEFAVTGADQTSLPFMASLGSETLSWIKASDLVATPEFKNVKCNLYRQVVTLRDDTGEAASYRKAVYFAWIDQATGVPVALADGGIRYEFAFDPVPPAEALVPPQRVQKELERYVRIMTPPRRL